MSAVRAFGAGAAAVLLAACTPAVAPSVAPGPASGSTGTSVAISAADLRLRLFAFADDSMMGREAGTIWNERASAYVAAQFQRLGLTPAGENGTLFQTVPNIRPRDAAATPGLARNVIAIVPGSDPLLRGEYVSITAHNDHLGFRQTAVDHDSTRAFNTVVRPLGADSPRRSATPEEATRTRVLLDSLRKVHPPRRDSIYNGADDDGSGTVALIELAEAFMKGSAKPRRSILFVSHTAEEEGLLGSEWYTDHPTVPIDSIAAEFEYDAPGHPDQYYCRADHYSYARYGIPSVSLSRGSHMDYHQLTDEPQYIDYADYTRLTQMVFDAASFVADADHRPKLDAPKPVNPHVPCKQ